MEKNSKKDVADFIQTYLTEKNISLRQAERITGVKASHFGHFLKHQEHLSIDSLFKFIDGLGLTIKVEEKMDEALMSRLRKMPKKLFCGERIEARSHIDIDGLEGRTDLFEDPNKVLKFMPAPCDVYEVSTNSLIRRKFDVVEHPFGPIYSYYDHIESSQLRHLVTYR